MEKGARERERERTKQKMLIGRRPANVSITSEQRAATRATASHAFADDDDVDDVDDDDDVDEKLIVDHIRPLSS